MEDLVTVEISIDHLNGLALYLSTYNGSAAKATVHSKQSILKFYFSLYYHVETLLIILI